MSVLESTEGKVYVALGASLAACIVVLPTIPEPGDVIQLQQSQIIRGTDFSFHLHEGPIRIGDRAPEDMVFEGFAPLPHFSYKA